MKTAFPGVYRIKDRIATLNLTPGVRVYDEKLFKVEGEEYREWDPFRSKLAAAIKNNLQVFPFRKNSKVLYLGASSGTTASHVSDICSEGIVYCLEYSKRMARDLYMLCEKRENMIPLIGDARYPEQYIHNISTVDIIYQDIAQPNQAEILLRNTERFAPRHAILAIKSRSINAVKNPKAVFREEEDKLRPVYDILQKIDIRPYDKDHVVLNLKSRQRS